MTENPDPPRRRGEHLPFPSDPTVLPCHGYAAVTQLQPKQNTLKSRLQHRIAHLQDDSTAMPACRSCKD